MGAGGEAPAAKRMLALSVNNDHKSLFYHGGCYLRISRKSLITFLLCWVVFTFIVNLKGLSFSAQGDIIGTFILSGGVIGAICFLWRMLRHWM